jgi:hypothetical protein
MVNSFLTRDDDGPNQYFKKFKVAGEFEYF